MKIIYKTEKQFGQEPGKGVDYSRYHEAIPVLIKNTDGTFREVKGDMVVNTWYDMTYDEENNCFIPRKMTRFKVFIMYIKNILNHNWRDR